MLIIILILLSLSVFVLWKSEQEWFSDSSIPLFVVSFFLVIICSVYLIAALGSNIKYRSQIAEYEGVKASIENARKADLSEIERAGLQKEIIDWNGRISKAKALNSMFVAEPFIYDDFCELPLLR